MSSNDVALKSTKTVLIQQKMNLSIYICFKLTLVVYNLIYKPHHL